MPRSTGLGDYFVGDRMRVWVSGGERTRLRRAGALSSRRASASTTCGCIRQGDRTVDVPVQRGRELPRPDMPDGLEILSGVRAGDGWCSRESRPFRTADPGDHPLAADAAVPARRAGRRPDRAARHPARGGAADQRADGRHPRQRRRAARRPTRSNWSPSRSRPSSRASTASSTSTARPRTTASWSRRASWSAPRPRTRSCASTRRSAPISTAFRSAFPSR